MAEEPKPVGRLGLKLDPTVNYGHLISATVFLVTAAMAWANLSNRQDDADRRIARLETSQERMVVENARESQVIVRLDEKITNLDRILARVERLLEGLPPRQGVVQPPNRTGG